MSHLARAAAGTARRRAHLVTTVFAVSALLLAASCSDDDVTSPGATEPATTDAPAPGTSTIVPPDTTGPASATTTTMAGATTVAARGTVVDAPRSTPPAEAATTEPESSTDGYPSQPAGVPYPIEAWPEGTLPGFVDGDVVDAAVASAFGAPDAEERVTAVVVVHGGEIVYEAHHPLDGPDVVHPSFSMAKSIASALMGLLATDGRLDAGDTVGRPEWPDDDPRASMTIEDLLYMSSGLENDWELLGDLFASENAAGWAASNLEMVAEPGTEWNYVQGVTSMLVGVASARLGGCEEVDRYLDERLFGPLGITTHELLRDGTGCWFGFFGANMTTRDFARFGLLYLRGGEWDGEQLIDTAWIDASRVPAPTNDSYGYHWWLSGDDMFRAEGLGGQRILVVPDHDLVIALNNDGGDVGTLSDVLVDQFTGGQITSSG